MGLKQAWVWSLEALNALEFCLAYGSQRFFHSHWPKRLAARRMNRSAGRGALQEEPFPQVPQLEGRESPGKHCFRGECFVFSIFWQNDWKTFVEHVFYLHLGHRCWDSLRTRFGFIGSWILIDDEGPGFGEQTAKKTSERIRKVQSRVILNRKLITLVLRDRELF